MDDLLSLDICQSKLHSLHGIENAKKLKNMVLSYNRSLEDISALSAVRDTAIRRSFQMEAAPSLSQDLYNYGVSM